jgi:hypothetical protein
VTYWSNSYINTSAGITTISSANAGCNDIVPEYGITGTPVIDPSSQTIYFVTNTTENGSYFSACMPSTSRTARNGRTLGSPSPARTRAPVMAATPPLSIRCIRINAPP